MQDGMYNLGQLDCPISVMEKMAQFGFSTSSSMIQEKTSYYLFYSDEDCSCSTLQAYQAYGTRQ